jgi:hypothetical protein
MKTYDPHNERIKRTYFSYLTDAKGYGETTLDAVAKALHRFETYTKFRDFKGFHIEQAKGFKTPETKIAIGSSLKFEASGPQALEQRRADPQDIQGRLRGGRPSLLQSAQLPENVSFARGSDLQVPGAFQDLVPEPRPRERPHHVLELR